MRHLLYIVLIALTAIAIWAAMLFGETFWLEDRVVPLAGTKLPEWLDSFKWWASTGILGTLFFSVLWYGLGQKVFSFNRWGRNYRPVWCLFLIIPITLGILGCLFTKQTTEGSTWAYVFYFLNNVITFYLGTSLFSPASVMYVPIGSEYLRHW